MYFSEIPQISSDLPRKVAVRAGEPLRLKVKVAGLPVPEVSWAKDGAPLPADSGKGTEEDGWGRS